MLLGSPPDMVHGMPSHRAGLLIETAHGSVLVVYQKFSEIARIILKNRGILTKRTQKKKGEGTYMTAVFVGKGVNCAFSKTVLKILKSKIEVFEISDTRIEKQTSQKAITVIFSNSPKLVNVNDAAVFLNQNTSAEISGEKYLIFDSSNQCDIKAAKNSGGEVITCGLSLRDSVTFSSMTEENCVISIQRSITGFDGKKTEPREIPCKIEACDDKYAVLCANLLLVLLGCSES